MLFGSNNETYVLSKVLNPQKMCVFGENLIVVDGFEFHLFSLTDLSNIVSFGREGDGPGELQANPYWYNSVSFSGDEIFIDSLNKVLYYSREGKFLRQKRKPVGISQMWPVGPNYLGLNQVHLEGDFQYVVLLLFDSDMNQIKELARQKSPVQSAKRTTEAIFDTLNFAVLKDEIFVEKSREGFVIDVFNNKGIKIRKIKRDVQRIPIYKKDRDIAIEHIKNDPTIKNLLGFEKLKEMTKFIYPDAYPSITGLIADENQLYVLTSAKRDGGTECLILDSRGSDLDRIYIPVVNPAPFVSQLLGIQFFTIADRKLYYADVEGEDTVLHIHEFHK